MAGVTKKESRHANEFTLAWLLETVVSAGLLSQAQASSILTKEAQARARVIKASGVDKYVPSPIEVLAAFQVPLVGKAGQFVDQDRISEVAAAAAGIGYKKIDPLKLDMNLAARTVSKPFAQKNCILALEGGGNPATPLVVAVANPFDHDLFENLFRLTGSPIVPVLSAKSDILKGIADVYGFKRTLAAAADDFADSSGSISNFEQLVSLGSNTELAAEDKPIIQAVEHLLRYAFDNRASDIHIEPKRDKSMVRFRIE